MMDGKEFAERMRQIEQEFKFDPEAKASKAEEVICALLTAWGYGEGVRIYEAAMEKW